MVHCTSQSPPFYLITGLSRLNSISELAELLLVVKRCKSTYNTEGNRNRRTATSLDNSRNSRASQENTVCQGKLRAVVLVVLEKVSYEALSAVEFY